MLLSEGINVYADHKRSAGFAESTVSNAYRNLIRVMDVIGDMPITEIDAIQIDRFFSVEMSRGLKPGTLNSYHYILSAFSKWCRRRGIIVESQDFVAGRRQYRDPPPQREYLPATDFATFLDIASTGPTGERDRALMASALYLMSRASELKHLKIKDVNIEYEEVEVFIQKTSERDTMPMCLELKIELEEWLAYYREQMGGSLDPEWVLFPRYATVAYHQFEIDPHNSLGRPQLVVQRCLKGLGWKDEWMGVHVLRRSAARARVEENFAAGYDGAMREIQAWLHHKALTTTERYLGMTIDRERRNDRTKGKSLYPSVAASKIVPMRPRGVPNG